MKKVFIADDGTHFDTEHECLAHEEKALIKTALLRLIRSKYHGNDVPVVSKIIADFVVSNFGQISEIVNGSVEPEWIPNSNNFNDYAPVHGETAIEVKYRNGFKETGKASEWSASWRSIDGAGKDIVAYRILKSQD
jgi:hypothetical protein